MTVKKILTAGAAVLAACGALGTVPAAAQASSAPAPAWTQQKTATSHPPARSQAAMAYDAATGTIVLFGGATDCCHLFGDTWTWDGSTWTRQAPGSSPSARSGAAAAYDAATSTVVLFGGFTTRDRNVRDTWTWG